MKNKKVFITGVTGTLGPYLLKDFLLEGLDVIVLAREKNGLNARTRVFNSLNFVFSIEESNRYLKRIRVVEGDIKKVFFGLRGESLIDIISETSFIVHAAALVDFNKPLDEIRLTNVNGTKNLLDFILRCKRYGILEKASYISTTYIAGKNSCKIFSEDMFCLDQEFNNTYEQTKYEGEMLVNNFIEQNNDVDIRIFRTSMLMGDSIIGKTPSFNLFYKPLALFVKGLASYLPADPHSLLNIVHVDHAAKLIVSLMFDTERAKVYHIVAEKDIFLIDFVSLASRVLDFNMPTFISIDSGDFLKLSPVYKKMMEPFIGYFNYKIMFSYDKTRKLLEKNNLFSPKTTIASLTKVIFYYRKILRVNQ